MLVEAFSDLRRLGAKISQIRRREYVFVRIVEIAERLLFENSSMAGARQGPGARRVGRRCVPAARHRRHDVLVVEVWIVGSCRSPVDGATRSAARRVGRPRSYRQWGHRRCSRLIPRSRGCCRRRLSPATDPTDAASCSSVRRSATRGCPAAPRPRPCRRNLNVHGRHTSGPRRVLRRPVGSDTDACVLRWHGDRHWTSDVGRRQWRPSSVRRDWHDDSFVVTCVRCA